MDLEHQFIQTNGITLHVAQGGSKANRLVLLLHGFPEFWYGWRHQIEFLTANNFRVWAPDQRGYNLSDKPRGVAAYNLDELAADAIGLIDAAGVEKAILVGHDWGAAVAWRAANKYPERWSRLVILNVAHPRVMRQQIRSNPAQLRRSGYMFSFQIPRLPEFFARQNHWRLLVQSMRASSRPGTFSDSDFDLYRKAWSQPTAFTAMLNWYRALFQTHSARLPSSRITVPTLMIWGAQDRFIGRELAQPSIDLCDEGRLVFIEQATHWVHHEEPEHVNALMQEFFNP